LERREIPYNILEKDRHQRKAEQSTDATVFRHFGFLETREIAERLQTTRVTSIIC